MKRLLLLASILLGCLPSVFADHITGGEVYYVLSGHSDGQYRYKITVRLFMRCSSGREFNNPTVISIFNPESGTRIMDMNVPLNRTETLDLTNSNPCITNPPKVCYLVGQYDVDVSLPSSSTGYIIAAQVMFRIDGINNLVSNYNQVGATYTSIIPSNKFISDAPENNSAHFTGNDLVVTCAGNAFSYSFGATDKDGDQLRYSFCNAYQTTGAVRGNNGTPPPPPPYSSVPYGNGYSGSNPLGDDIRIDPNTGMITGIAPAVGVYVVTVCVEEIRDGVVIAIQRKDLQINITSCAIAAAALPAEFMVCGENKRLSAANLSTSPLINSYNWEFLNNKDETVFTSTGKVAEHTFADTGTYIIKLVINSGQQCADSTFATARVYPGFAPDFMAAGSCINKPTSFTDATTSVYGIVNGWTWNFGESNADESFSTEQNPHYSYQRTGNKNVRLIVSNSMGCRDTVFKSVSVFDKPPIDLAFRDTLICPPDALQLKASGTGKFSWSPSASINSHSAATPVVSPLTTTTYYVELDADGCINRDSVKVNVVDQVSLKIMEDTTICRGDELRLSIETNGLKYTWAPANSLDNALLRNPVAIPEITTTYQVTAAISGCTNTENVTVTTVPYPSANAGPDTMICYNTVAPLHAGTDGSSFSWKPEAGLQDINSLNPVAMPVASTSYVFYAYDKKGCPKPGIDTVRVTVLGKIEAFAGRDTAIVIGQPLQLNASGGTTYDWAPTATLSDNKISNPVALFSTAPPGGQQRYRLMVFNEAGCVDSAFLNVRVFPGAPDIYVPSAFTPNGDGLNDVFKPVAAGIQQINMFQVYNRWGQLLYSSPIPQIGGWDGTFNGQAYPTGTFVWLLKATDFNGTPIYKKGTVTLIR